LKTTKEILFVTILSLVCGIKVTRGVSRMIQIKQQYYICKIPKSP